MRQRLAFLVLAGAALAGCLMAFPAPKAISPVYTDWSKLTDYQSMEALYETFEPYAGDHLTARDDYGPLLRYIGASVIPDDYFPFPMPLYGLMTADGRVVTDPVYADIYLAAEYYGIMAGTKRDYAPFLILRTGDEAQKAVTNGIYFNGARVTVAAPDGSWVLEGDFSHWALLEGQRMALTGMDSSFTVIDHTGATVAAFPREALTPYLGEDYRLSSFYDEGFYIDWRNGIGCISDYSEFLKDPDNYQYSLYLNPEDSSISRQPPEGFSFQRPEYVDVPRQAFPGYRNADPLTDPFTGALYYRGLREGDDWVIDMLDEQGGLLVESCETGYTYPSWVWNGLIAKVDHDVFSYYDLNGDCIFRYPLRSNID